MIRNPSEIPVDYLEEFNKDTPPLFFKEFRLSVEGDNELYLYDLEGEGHYKVGPLNSKQEAFEWLLKYRS